MILRKNRLLQVLFTLMLITVILPILFNIFISRAYQSVPLTVVDSTLDPFSLYASHDGISEKLATLLESVNGSSANLTALVHARQNYLRSVQGNSLEDQIAYGFADLTNRLRFAESYANERRQEINQLMKEIRYLWKLIQKQSNTYGDGRTGPLSNSLHSNTTSNSSTIFTNGKFFFSRQFPIYLAVYFLT